MTDKHVNNPNEPVEPQRAWLGLTAALRRVKLGLIGLHLAEVVLGALVVLPLLALALIALDAMLDASPELRLALLVAGGVGFGILAVRKGLVPLIRLLLLSRHALAHRLEAHFPELQSRLVTVLDLYPEIERQRTPFSQRLAALAVRSAAAEAANRKLTRMIPLARVKSRALALLAVAVATLLVFGANPDGMLDRLGRFARIGHDMRLARAYIELTVTPLDGENVNVVEETGDAVRLAVIAGSDVALAIRAASSEPAPVKLHRRARGADAATVSLIGQAGAGEDAMDTIVSLGALDEDEDVYVSLGQVASPRFQVEVTRHPVVETVQIRYRFPAYTRLDPEFLPHGDGRIRVLLMSEAEVTVVADKPLLNAVFEVYGRRVAAQVRGRQATTRFLVTGDGAYSVSLTDHHRFEMQEPYGRPITAVRDRPPEVTVDAAEELLLTPRQITGTAVNLEARDDYGVATVRLLYEVSKLPDIRLATERAPGVRQREHTLRVPQRRVRMAYPTGFEQLGLHVGEVVTYWIEVEDADNLNGPNVGRSPSFRLVVVEEELRTWAEIEDEDRWPSSLRGLLGDSQEAAGGIRALRTGMVRAHGEAPDPTSEGVSVTAEGYVPPEHRAGFSVYTERIDNH